MVSPLCNSMIARTPCGGPSTLIADGVAGAPGKPMRQLQSLEASELDGSDTVRAPYRCSKNPVSPVESQGRQGGIMQVQQIWIRVPFHNSAAEGAWVDTGAVAVRSWVDLAPAPRVPDPDERDEQEEPTEQSRPHEDAQHHEQDGGAQPQPRVPPPRPLRRPWVAERRGQVRLREPTPAAQHVTRRGALSE